MKFKQLNESYESEKQSDLYSRHADQLVDFVKEKMKQKTLSNEDRQKVIDMMISYGKRMYYKGKNEKENNSFIFDVNKDAN